MFPDRPVIPESVLKECQEKNDYRKIQYEWYKYVASLCAVFSCFLQESKAICHEIPKRDYGVLIGLVYRCSRLMLANVKLSQNGLFGESTSILDRCIFESAIRLIWLCNTDGADRFDRYIAAGLHSEIELEEQIKINIKTGGRAPHKIESRMLSSVSACIEESGISREQITTIKKLPNLSQMIESVGLSRLTYTVGQRIGSHHIHGTWVGLRHHYIEFHRNGDYVIKNESETHGNQYFHISVFVLQALEAYSELVVVDPAQKHMLHEELEFTHNEIGKIGSLAAGDDYNEE